MPVDVDACAQELFEVHLLVFKTIRPERLQADERPLSMVQFRVLFLLRRRPGTSLSEVAANVGLALPTASHLVDGLVERELVVRERCSDDRRRIALSLTEEGRRLLEAVRRAAQQRLAEVVATFSDAERESVQAALQLLRSRFSVSDCADPASA